MSISNEILKTLSSEARVLVLVAVLAEGQRTLARLLSEHKVRQLLFQSHSSPTLVDEVVERVVFEPVLQSWRLLYLD